MFWSQCVKAERHWMWFWRPVFGCYNKWAKCQQPYKHTSGNTQLSANCVWLIQHVRKIITWVNNKLAILLPFRPAALSWRGGENASFEGSIDLTGWVFSESFCAVSWVQMMNRVSHFSAAHTEAAALWRTFWKHVHAVRFGNDGWF